LTQEGILSQDEGMPFWFRHQKIKHGGSPLARTNFSFTKRQKELERKKKQEEKRQRKLDKKNPPNETVPDELQPPVEDESPRPVS
jgi:hypothetical protein